MTTDTMPDYAAHYEPPSLRWILDSGGDPLDALQPWWSGGTERIAVVLAEHLHSWAAWADVSEAGRLEGSAKRRSSVASMVEAQCNFVPSTRPSPPGAFQRVVLSELWAAEVLEDPGLVDRALDAAGCRDLYDGITWVMALPDDDDDELVALRQAITDLRGALAMIEAGAQAALASIAAWGIDAGAEA